MYENVIIPNVKLDDDEREVIDLFAKIQNAMILKDISFLKGIYLPDSSLTHISGKVQSSEMFLSELESGVLNYFKSVLCDGFKVSVDGDLAILEGELDLTAKVYGSSGTWHLDMWRSFKKVDGVWFSLKEVYK